MTDANPKSGAKSRIPAIDDTPENLRTLKGAEAAFFIVLTE